MTTNVEVQTRNIRLTDRIQEHVEQRAGKLDHYLPVVEEARVELTHDGAARNANDRNVAQITVKGKGVILRTEERADEVLAAFDIALDKLRRQLEKYKGKHYRGRGDGRSAADVVAEDVANDETEEVEPVIARRKKFIILPMNEMEAIEQMNLLGHNSFFIFYNAETSKINVLYRRRNDTYGLIEPEIG